MIGSVIDVVYRPAVDGDALSIAALHADSWRRHYRGMYSDDYLDGPVAGERRELWLSRFSDRAGTATTIAEVDGTLAGFIHVILDADPEHGALVDNLHVRHDRQRLGIGEQLMRRAAAGVVAARPGSGVYLWVLEQNVRARAFYRSIGGAEADREDTEPPGGGVVTGIRVVWPDPTTLLGPSGSSAGR
jgi:ribosomal protein S18 acetylase RimI-like enzyme